MSIRGRLFVSSFILLLPLSISLFFLMSSYREQTNIANTELEGSALIRQIIPILQDLSAISDSGNIADAPGMDTRLAAVKKECARLEAVLLTDADHMQAAGIEPGLIDLLATHWQDIRQGGAESVRNGATRMVNDLSQLIAYLADSSTLILDPDLGSYSSMYASVVALPATMQRLSAAGLQLGGFAASESLEVVRQLQITGIMLKRTDLVQIGKAVNTAFRGDAAGFGPTPGIPDIATTSLAAFSDSITDLAGSLETIGYPASESYIKGLHERLAKARVNSGKLQAEMQDLMDRQLRKRADWYSLRSTLILMVCLVALALSFGIIILITGNLVRNLRSIGRSTGEIAAGRLNEAIPARLCERRDEIGELSRAVEAMRDNMVANIVSIKGTAADLATLDGSLTQTVESAAQSVDRIAGQVEETRQRISYQAAGVTETSATVLQILKNIESLGSELESQSRCLAESGNSLEQMRDSINQVSSGLDGLLRHGVTLRDASDKGRNCLADMSEQIDSIVGFSEKLAEANNAIRTMSTQTNLLAMNAAIEAAHAGNAGRGFSVVATEIRKLAEQSAEQSSAISQDIASIQEMIRGMVGSSRLTEEAFDAIRSLIQQLGSIEDSLDGVIKGQSRNTLQVLETINLLQGATGRVRNTSQEINLGSLAIRQEMANLLQGSEAVSRAMDEIVQSTDRIGESTEAVQATSRQSTGLVETLVSRTIHYRTE